MVGRDTVRDAGLADLAFRANQPLCERGLRNEECAGDLGRRQAPERPQGQRDLGFHRQGRVAAGEDQAQAIVRDGAHLVRTSFRTRWFGPKLGQLRKQPLLLLEAFRAPQPVDRLVAGGRGDPRARVVGNTRLRPALQGDDERLLDGLLREVEIAEHPDERRDRPSRLLAKHAVDDCVGFSQTPVSAPELQAGAPGLVDPDRTTVNQPTARRLTQRPRRSPTAAPR